MQGLRGALQREPAGDGSVFVEPDVSVVCDPGKLSDRGCEGAPDLVMELVSPSNWQLDYFRKASLHESAGVRERWIANPRSRQIHMYQAGRAAGVRPGADRAAGRPRQRA